MATDVFADNRDFLFPSTPEGVDEEAFKKFIEQHGPEVAKGYLLAIADIQPKIRGIYHAHSGGSNYYTPTQTEMRNTARKLYLHLKEFLDFGTEIDLGDFHLNKNANLQQHKP